MTSLAKSLALLCIVVLGIGMYGENILLAIPSVAILLWMISAYGHFTWVHRGISKSLTVERTIHDRAQENVYLWADRLYTVELRLKSKQRLPRSFQIRDIVPDLMQLQNDQAMELSGTISSHVDSTQDNLPGLARWFWAQFVTTNHRIGIIDRSTTLVDESTKALGHRYRIRPRAAGLAIFPGVRLEHTDTMKWFRADYFVACRQVTRVMPKFREEAELRQLLKTTNSIPQHGLHRQRKPGMGFELLELREYVDGDPPKSIAWKASARRETLMIRQYESEVPIRLQIFIEATVGCRIGSFGRRVFDQMTILANSLAKIVTSHGDAVGGYFVNQNGVTRFSASFGEEGFYRIAKGLALLSASEFPNRFRWTVAMQQAVYALIGEYYPDFLRLSINPAHVSFFDLSLSSLKRQRNQICRVLAEHYHLSDLEQVEMMLDDDSLAKWMQRYLCEHGREWIYPMIPESDVPIFLSQNALGYFVRSVQQSVQSAKDNEVFVLILDLLSIDRDIESLIQALKVARGRHHRVVVVSQSPTFEALEKSNLKSIGNYREFTPDNWRGLASKIEIEERYLRVKSQLNSIGVPFSVTSDDSSIPVILREVELARSGRLAAKTGRLS